MKKSLCSVLVATSGLVNADVGDDLALSCIEVDSGISKCLAFSAGGQIGPGIVAGQNYLILGSGDSLKDLEDPIDLLAEFLDNHEIPESDLIKATWCEEPKRNEKP